MSLTCKLQLVLNNVTAKEAKAIRDAIEPDNVEFPEGLSLYVENIDNKLVFNFKSMKDIKQLVGTVDEVVEHIQVALKVIQ